METEQLANRLSDLASRAGYLANTIYLAEDTSDERICRDAHELRETLGLTLVLLENLARQTGNDPMVTLHEDGGVGRVSYDIALDEADIAEAKRQ